MLRGLASQDRRRLGHFTDDPVVLDFVTSEKHPALAALGTSCPDHFLRTKVRPMVLDLPPDAEPTRSWPGSARCTPPTARTIALITSGTPTLPPRRESAATVAGDLGSADVAVPVTADVTSETDVASAFASAALAFGGVDLVVNNAGLSISKPLADTSVADWDLLHDVLARG